MNGTDRGGIGVAALGLPWLLVTIESIQDSSDNGRVAVVRDQYGSLHEVQTNLRRSKGPPPLQGETWVIDRALGGWTFAACVVTAANEGVSKADLDAAVFASDSAGADRDAFFWTQVNP